MVKLSSLILIGVILTIVTLLGFILEKREIFLLSAVVAVFFGMGYMKYNVQDKIIEPQDFVTLCEQEHISYTLVNTISEMTGIPESDAYTIVLYGCKNEANLDEVIYYINSSLTKEQVDAIIALSDMRQANQENGGE